jgi:hypothetical protein|tara:strand:+ start:743 stop:973 length:231 start_codon:yes stop_codon:yes gene_type:complete
MNKFLSLLESLNFTAMFKDKKFGDGRRWSAKRTVGGVLITYALASMDGDITWEGLVLCALGILPLCLSMFEVREIK